MTTYLVRRTRLVLGASVLALALPAACSPPQRNFGSGGGGAGSTSSGSGQGGSGVAAQTSVSSTASGVCDTKTVTDCGSCGHDCTKLSNVDPNKVGCDASGSCVVPPAACDTGYAHCSQSVDDGCEVHTDADSDNCGVCGKACFIGQLCGASMCNENQVSCVLTGTCAQAFCNDLGHYSVTKGIVVDLKTNRTLWQRTAFPNTMDYATAVKSCDSLVIEGVDHWRVPTSAELGAIVYKAGGLNGCPSNYCSPCLDQAAFLGTQSEEYWTSSPYMAGINYCVSFCDGRSSPWKEDVTSSHFVRCVHDPVP